MLWPVAKVAIVKYVSSHLGKGLRLGSSAERAVMCDQTNRALTYLSTFVLRVLIRCRHSSQTSGKRPEITEFYRIRYNSYCTDLKIVYEMSAISAACHWLVSNLTSDPKPRVFGIIRERKTVAMRVTSLLWYDLYFQSSNKPVLYNFGTNKGHVQ